MQIDLYEDNAGTLIMVDGDTANDMTEVQFQSTFKEDVEAWLEQYWHTGDPGRSFNRVDGLVFRSGDIRIDLSNWTHVATYEDGEVKRHEEGGFAANNYLSTEPK